MIQGVSPEANKPNEIHGVKLGFFDAERERFEGRSMQGECHSSQRAEACDFEEKAQCS